MWWQRGGGASQAEPGASVKGHLADRFFCIYEGFCEGLARQNVVAQLSQLQLRFRRRHIWVSVIAVVS
jgi:hypothetical protein